MPLPSLRLHSAKQCRARSKRSGNQCLNPAAFGMPTCRMHGARQAHTVRAGEAHQNFKHGFETLPAKVHRSQKLAELKEIKGLMRILRMLC